MIELMDTVGLELLTLMPQPIHGTMLANECAATPQQQRNTYPQTRTHKHVAVPPNLCAGHEHTTQLVQATIAIAAPTRLVP